MCEVFRRIVVPVAGLLAVGARLGEPVAGLQPPRRRRSYPRKVKRVRCSRHLAKQPGERGVRHDRPPAACLDDLPEQVARTT
ncbi:hypothetical protein [Streptomyces adonidis]|uniref:hypothetical protein n=1 Tax=Streptomyces adonidis TaxID=3231367 RepID=UPI0034DB6B92